MVIFRRGDRGAVVKEIQRALKVWPDGIFGVNTEEAVKAFQQRNHLKVDGIVGVKTLALLGVKMVTPRTKRRIKEIIVHCTATPEGKDFTVDQIRQWHKMQGWSDIGYHYVVYRNGVIANGRPVDIAGAHCQGHNQYSIGVCYVGGVERDGKTPKDTRTLAQKAALLNLLTELMREFPDAKIYGHRDFACKACPSFDAMREYKAL